MEEYSKLLIFELCKKTPSNLQDAFTELQGIIGARLSEDKESIYIDRMNVTNRITVLWKRVFKSSINVEIKRYKDHPRFYFIIDNNYHKLLQWNGDFPRSFLRGVFISCGFISNPEKYYRIELIPIHKSFPRKIGEALSLLKIGYKVYNKRVIISGLAGVEKFLNSIGVKDGLIKVEEVRASKLANEDTNRKINFQQSNIERTLNAADREIKAINKLIEMGKLSENYMKMATLRLQYPQATLEELAQLTQPPVTKSTVSYYMKRLERLANDSIEDKS
ncbi:MAG: DNA-binding protein WhiA [bacterium]